MLPSVLEIQVPQPGRAPQGGLRNHHFDPADRQGEQPVGRGAHPWRTHEARIRVANLPQVQAGGPQSRITSALHSPTPPMVRIGHPSSRITPSWSGPVTFSQSSTCSSGRSMPSSSSNSRRSLWCHLSPDGRLGDTTASGSDPLWPSPSFLDSRPGLQVRRRCAHELLGQAPLNS